jgi:hypothetical protein
VLAGVGGVPSCPICTDRTGEAIRFSGERRYLCGTCNTIYNGGPDEWDRMRDRRDDYLADRERRAAEEAAEGITVEPEAAGMVLGSLNEPETEEPDGRTVDSAATPPD